MKNEIEKSFIQNNIEYFNEKEFIILKEIRANQVWVLNLVIQIKSLCVFVMKNLFVNDLETMNFNREKHFCENYGHRCFLHFYGFSTNTNEDGNSYNKRIGLIYEYMSHDSLNKYMNQHRDESECFKLVIIIRLCQAIKYLHSNKLLHRDIKHSNILLNHDLFPYISDFETVRNIDENKEFTQDIGSGQFCSPEQMNGEKTSFPTDIYSFGRIIKYLFKKNGEKYNDKIQLLIEKCTKENPKDRPSINEVESNIKEIVLLFLFSKTLSINDAKKCIYELFMIQNESIEYIQYVVNSFLSSEHNISYAYYCLGYLYEKGYGFEKNYDKAKEYYGLSAKENNPKAYFKLGHIYEGKKNYTEAIKNYEMSEKLGNSDASYCLGYFYEKGYGFPQDYKKAFEYIKKAADKNNEYALNKLGHFYENSLGVKQDYEKAKQYYELASKHNFSKAQCNLAYLYYRGLGTPKDYLKAKELLLLASKENNSIALYGLGDLYENGFGVPQSYPEAKKYYELSANLNDSNALCKLGYYYEKGYGGEQNYDKAEECYDKAKKYNNFIAFYCIGRLYQYRYDGKKDIHKAKDNYKKSIKIYESLRKKQTNLNLKGYYELSVKSIPFDVYYNLAFLYEMMFYRHPKHISKYFNKAKEFYRKAKEYYNENINENDNNFNYSNVLCKIGLINENEVMSVLDYRIAKIKYEEAAKLNHSFALYQLGILYEDPEKAKKCFILCENPLKAMKCFILSGNKNNSYSLYKLGTFFENGNGVKKNYTMAKIYFEKSARQGNADAYLKLGHFYKNGYGVQQNIAKAIENYKYSFYNNGLDALYFLSNIYSNHELFENVEKSKIYLLKSIEKIKQVDEVYFFYDDFYYFKTIENNYYYHSYNDLGLIYIVYFQDKKKAEEYIKTAAMNNYQFAENNYGVLIEFYLKKGGFEEYYTKSSKKGFVLADYNLGYLNEKRNNDKYIDYYKKVSDNECSTFTFNNETVDDKRLEISIKFITCLANLKLAEYYFSNSQIEESKKYFIRAFSKLILSKGDLSNKFEYELSEDNPEKLYSYLYTLILGNKLFNLANQTNLKSEIKEKISRINENDIKNKNTEENNIYMQEQNDESNLNLLQYKQINVKRVKIDKEIYDLFTNKPKNEINQKEKEFGELFDFIIFNKKYKNLFAKEIKNIIKIMQEIIYTPPYPILFGRIFIGEKKQEQEQEQKLVNIGKMFEDGFVLTI